MTPSFKAAPWVEFTHDVRNQIDEVKARYGGRLSRYQWDVIECRKKNTFMYDDLCLLSGFFVGAWFGKESSVYLLLDWPFVDLDDALASFKYWRSMEGLATVAGMGVLQRATFALDDIELIVDDRGELAVKRFDVAIRADLREGVFPRWNIFSNGTVDIDY